MEGIKLSSESLFDKEQKFRDPPVGYKFDAIELHKLSKAPGQPDSAATKVLSLSQDNLCTWLSPTSQDNTVEHTPEASLRLVSIRRDLDVTLCISKSSFTTIFHSIKAHPSIKYTICRDYDGFHEFCGDGFRLTRFLGNPLYALVWTFDPDTMTTAAMFLDRRRHTFTKFTNMLREHSSLISTPSLLAFVSSYFLLQFFDLETGGWELNTVRTVEERTGFGPHPTGYRGLEPLTLVQSYDISQLTSWLQAMSEVAGNASNRARHVRMCLSVLKKIGDEHERREDHGIPGQVAERHRHSLAAIAKAIPQVEQHILTYIDYLMYLKDRSERLCTVLFALLTHEDAHASIDLAAASRRDGSSMKTIAVVTMVFLPATFYAALFAVPSLQWDRDTVIQDNFWVYWAFTLPTKAAVFLVWMGITGRSWLRERALGLYKSRVSRRKAYTDGSAVKV